jgi:hypothetical protein
MKIFFKHIILLIFFCNAYAVSFSQDSLLTDHLIKRIASQQTNAADFFIKGIFPSYISNSQHFRNHQKDNNIFYNGLISFTLKNIHSSLSEKNNLLIDSILSNARSCFVHFKNKKGRNTYNFWRTDSAFVFPYTKWIRLLKKNTDLPDDMDDTVLSLFALDANDSAAEEVHQLMQHYVNSDSNKVRIEDSGYQNIPAYSTWFGKKFPVVFDVCVMSNILSFVQMHNLKWTKADSASLNYIIAVLNNKDIIDRPLEVSPYYGKTSIILYHLARLMKIKPIAELEAIKPYLIAAAVNEFAETDNMLEKIILCSSIMKWGYNPPPINVPAENKIEKMIEKNDMPFFIGNIPSYLQSGEKNFLLMNNIGLFYHYCPAYNDALLVEYLALKNGGN